MMVKGRVDLENHHLLWIRMCQNISQAVWHAKTYIDHSTYKDKVRAIISNNVNWCKPILKIIFAKYQEPCSWYVRTNCVRWWIQGKNYENYPNKVDNVFVFHVDAEGSKQSFDLSKCKRNVHSHKHKCVVWTSKISTECFPIFGKVPRKCETVVFDSLSIVSLVYLRFPMKLAFGALANLGYWGLV